MRCLTRSRSHARASCGPPDLAAWSPLCQQPCRAAAHASAPLAPASLLFPPSSRRTAHLAGDRLQPVPAPLPPAALPGGAAAVRLLVAAMRACLQQRVMRPAGVCPHPLPACLGVPTRPCLLHCRLHAGGPARRWRSMPATRGPRCCPTAGWTPGRAGMPSGTQPSGSWPGQVRLQQAATRLAAAFRSCVSAQPCRPTPPCPLPRTAAGELHNNVRMTWGKAFLQWAPSPDAALR